MKHILLLGAGRSSRHLIAYLLEHTQKHQWILTIGDLNLEVAQKQSQNHPNVRVVLLDSTKSEELSTWVQQSDVVISLLPPNLHPLVARWCLAHGKSLFTASYVSDELKAMHSEVERKGLLFLNEIGLDPGIDHMSALRVIHRIEKQGGVLSTVESFTGGLIAPESDTNPWNYKFTWNPRNVVLAGQGVVKFVQQGQYKYIPYQKVFRRTEIIELPDYGIFEGYANRDSLKYRDLYGLHTIPTFYRGTLRRLGFCRSWDTFVQLGATDDTYVLEGSQNMTHRDFINSFLAYHPSDSVEIKLAHYLQFDRDSYEMHKLKWLGIFEREPIGLAHDASPARILQQILEKKWTPKPNDHDMIVMWHRFIYSLNNQEHEEHTYMVAKGTSMEDTAMSRTVGLPLAIVVRLYLEGKIQIKGVHIPILPQLYTPILEELEQVGIAFVEHNIRTESD